MYIAELVFRSIKTLQSAKMSAGRTNIQKIIFLSLSEKEALSYYEPYYYGPYSEDVQRTMQLIEQEKIISYENPMNGYSFSAGFDFDKAIEKSHKNPENYARNIEKVVSFLNKKNIKEVNDIAAFAKVYYFRITSDATDDAALNKYITERAPHTWPDLMKYANRFSQYIEYSKELLLNESA